MCLHFAPTLQNSETTWSTFASVWRASKDSSKVLRKEAAQPEGERRLSRTKRATRPEERLDVSKETTAIAAVGATLLVATLGMGAFMFNAIAGVRGDVAALRTDVAELRTDVDDLRERMARLEGLFGGFAGRTGESGA